VATSAARRLAQLSARLADLDKVIVNAVGQVVVEAIEDQMNADTGGGTMSGVSKGRYRLQLKISPLNNPPGVRIRPAQRQSGMWQMMETGASAHKIAARPRRRHKGKGKAARSSSRATAMSPGGRGFRAGPFNHPGSRGKRTWSKGVDKGMAAAIDRAGAELHRAVTGG
jgi:hypothetical protein